jgi:hypothetical protein
MASKHGAGLASPLAGGAVRKAVYNGKRDLSISNRGAVDTEPTIRAELIGTDIATRLGTTARNNSPVLELCRSLIGAGHNPSARLEAYRGSTLCLTVRSIGEGAQLRTATHGVGFERLPEAQEPRTSRKTGNATSDSGRPASAHPASSGASNGPIPTLKVAEAVDRPRQGNSRVNNKSEPPLKKPPRPRW